MADLYTEAYLDKARQHGKMAHRIEALEKEVAELKERLSAPEPLLDTRWREYVTTFDPSKHDEWSWEEVLVSLGVLFGAGMNHEHDQIKKTLARLVSICEHMENRRMVPGDIKPIQMDAKVLFTYFQPEGSEEEAATQPWCYGELGDLAASWLRSLYA